MISYFMLGTNNLPAAIKFYDTLMTEMGATKAYENDRMAGWGWGIGTPIFIINKPYNEQVASVGNGTMISFDASTPELVNRFHAKALELGGSNEGDPGMRGQHMYVAYCRDLDGNKMNFIHYLPPSQ